METPGSAILKQDQRYTLKDWKTWPEGERWELIEGKVWNMSPAPRIIHQRVLGALYQQLSEQLKNKPCEPFIAPVDVFLEGSDQEEKTTVVQPDLMVVCDPSKCRDHGIFGPPDWVLEILYPSTSWKDQTEKRNIYEKFGVLEYWILNPDTLDLIMYQREDKNFGPPIGAKLDRLVSPGLFPEIRVVLK